MINSTNSYINYVCQYFSPFAKSTGGPTDLKTLQQLEQSQPLPIRRQSLLPITTNVETTVNNDKKMEEGPSSDLLSKVDEKISQLSKNTVDFREIAEEKVAALNSSKKVLFRLSFDIEKQAAALALQHTGNIVGQVKHNLLDNTLVNQCICAAFISENDNNIQLINKTQQLQKQSPPTHAFTAILKNAICGDKPMGIAPFLPISLLKKSLNQEQIKEIVEIIKAQSTNASIEEYSKDLVKIVDFMKNTYSLHVDNKKIDETNKLFITVGILDLSHYSNKHAITVLKNIRTIRDEWPPELRMAEKFISAMGNMVAIMKDHNDELKLKRWVTTHELQTQVAKRARPKDGTILRKTTYVTQDDRAANISFKNSLDKKVYDQIHKDLTNPIMQRGTLDVLILQKSSSTHRYDEASDSVISEHNHLNIKSKPVVIGGFVNNTTEYKSGKKSQFFTEYIHGPNTFRNNGCLFTNAIDTIAVDLTAYQLVEDF